MDFWRTLNGIARIRLATRRFARLAAEDLYASLKMLPLFEPLQLGNVLKNLGATFGVRSQSRELEAKLATIASSTCSKKPVIFVSACEDEKKPGGWKYCGGIKELSSLVKLLRRHGYEAYMVTWDGTYEPWLIEHQPHLSIPQFREKLRQAPNARCVTSLACSRAFIEPSASIYFWDMELASTESFHFHLLARLHRQRKIRRVAAISRTIQAWHMAHFETPATVIPVTIDDELWFPVESERVPRQVCYFVEGEETAEQIRTIAGHCQAAGLELEFVELRGDEVTIRSQMRASEVWLGMNPGKDLLWGEGCPRATLECMFSGCVLIAFDIIGNREIVQSGFNGILVPRNRPDLMAKELIKLFHTPGTLERYRSRTQELAFSVHTLEARWPAVREFLDLPDAE